jgi:hypothetical protein
VPVDQWNVSLKLAKSGVPESRRLRDDAIISFRELGAWFEFVVGAERESTRCCRSSRGTSFRPTVFS